MSKKAIFAVVLIILGIGAGTAILLQQQKNRTFPEIEAHVHQWSQWGDPSPDDTHSRNQFIQFRHCTNCGVSEFRVISETK